MTKTKATEVINWLKNEFEWEHTMAIYATFKGKTK